jgi:hypothetical protein
MGFQKINIRDRYKKVVVFLGVSHRQFHLNEPKQIFSKLSSLNFFQNFNYYFIMKIQKTKNFGVLNKKKNIFF